MSAPRSDGHFSQTWKSNPNYKHICSRKRRKVCTIWSSSLTPEISYATLSDRVILVRSLNLQIPFFLVGNWCKLKIDVLICSLWTDELIAKMSYVGMGREGWWWFWWKLMLQCCRCCCCCCTWEWVDPLLLLVSLWRFRLWFWFRWSSAASPCSCRWCLSSFHSNSGTRNSYSLILSSPLSLLPPYQQMIAHIKIRF